MDKEPVPSSELVTLANDAYVSFQNSLDQGDRVSAQALIDRLEDLSVVASLNTDANSASILIIWSFAQLEHVSSGDPKPLGL